jgi:hypothetical protein
VIEMTRFRLAPGVGENEFCRADKALQEDFAYQQPGLLRRTTARNDEGWIVIDLWRSDEDADRCAERWESDPAVAAFMALIDRSSVHTYRYQEFD